MASRKNLKKAIHADIEEMLYDLSILYSVAPNERQEGIAAVIEKTLDYEVETIAKISHTDGRGEANLVRKYYNELKAQYSQFAQTIEADVKKLCKELLKPEPDTAK